jgi:hypothetical protein
MKLLEILFEFKAVLNFVVDFNRSGIKTRASCERKGQEGLQFVRRKGADFPLFFRKVSDFHDLISTLSFNRANFKEKIFV